MLATPDDAVWFLSRADFSDADADAADGSDDAFAWNAFELMSVDAAESAPEREQITAFWAEHTPLLLSVRGPYAYLALRSDGAVVYGEEPEFELTASVALDFASFVRDLGDGVLPTPLAAA